jgi:hypothetical protein
MLIAYLKERRKVSFDKEGKIKGFQQETNYKLIKFQRDEILYFKYRDLGEGIRPLGLIEPIYQTIVRKLNVEEGLAQNVYRHGFPLFVGKVGDELHEPSDSAVKALSKNLSDLDYKSKLVIPYYFQVETLPGSPIEPLQSFLDYLIGLQAANFGIPKAVLLGSGKGEGKTILDSLQKSFDSIIRQIRKSISSPIEDFLSSYLGLDVYFSWGIVSMVSLPSSPSE